MKIIILLISLTLTASNTYSMSNIEQSLAHALVQSLGIQTALATREIAKRSDTSPSSEYLTIVAGAFIEEEKKNNNNEDLVKALYSTILISEDPKFFQVLYKYKAYKENKKKKSRKNKIGSEKYIDWSSYENKSLNVAQLPPETFDLETLKSNYIFTAANTQFDINRGNAFKSLTKDDSVDDMYQALGQPEAVKVQFINLVMAKVVNLSLYYKHMGRIVLQLDDKQWFISSITPTEIGFESYMPYFKANDLSDTTTKDIIIASASADEAFAVLHMASILYRLDSAPEPLVDAFAARLQKNLDQQLSPQMDDASAWIIKLLAKHDIGRYKYLILASIDSKQNPKLVKYAKKYKKKANKSESNNLYPEKI